MNLENLQNLNASPLARVGSAFGPVWQLGYVPNDLQASLHYWTHVMGAGPFLVRDRLKLSHVQYRGAPCDIEFGAALGYWGDLNIELIFQVNGVSSIYNPWSNDGTRDRLHHLGFLVDNVGQSVAQACQLGAQVIQEAMSPDGTGALAYVDMGIKAPHGYLEFVQMNEAWRDAHAWLRDAALHWDGRDPVRMSLPH